jgi:hypothetical protein
MSGARTAAVRVERRKAVLILPIAPKIATGLPGA